MTVKGSVQMRIPIYKAFFTRKVSSKIGEKLAVGKWKNQNIAESLDAHFCIFGGGGGA